MDVAGVVKSMSCRNTMMAWDLNPKVKHQQLMGETTITGNGFVSEKMDGDVEKYRKICKSEAWNCMCECGNKLMSDMLEALTCLRRHNRLHTDVKLDNILYKFRPGQNSSQGCPDFKLADFDLLTPVGQNPNIITPPLRHLIRYKMEQGEEALYAKGRKLSGFEDIAELALAYQREWHKSKLPQMSSFLKFARSSSAETTPDEYLRQLLTNIECSDHGNEDGFEGMYVGPYDCHAPGEQMDLNADDNGFIQWISEQVKVSNWTSMMGLATPFSDWRMRVQCKRCLTSRFNEQEQPKCQDAYESDIYLWFKYDIFSVNYDYSSPAYCTTDPEYYDGDQMLAAGECRNPAGLEDAMSWKTFLSG